MNMLPLKENFNYSLKQEIEAGKQKLRTKRKLRSSQSKQTIISSDFFEGVIK
jgi:hypothetical protein